MAFVQDINTSEDGDLIYETIGLVTLEDIIEEIIQVLIQISNDSLRTNP
jgi:CBS domain containing-hemolysin-like protein